MLKILSSNQIRHVDQFTIKKEPISSIDLMERASAAFTDWFLEKCPHGVTVHIFCGIGNNGGDGLAIARMLVLRKYQVKVHVIGDIERGSKEFKINFKRLRNLIEIDLLKSTQSLHAIADEDVIIDAIFGSGLSRAVEGFHADVINFINYQNAVKIAVDISSGLLADEFTKGNAIVRPDFTVAFQVPKLAFLFPESYPYVGEWQVIDIGLNKRYIAGLESNYHLLQEADLQSLIPPRTKFTHKGKAGKVLLIAGSTGKAGAAILSSRAILRAGAGLLTVRTPQECLVPLQAAVPEAMVDVDAHQDNFSFPPSVKLYNSIAVGPGLGVNFVTHQAVGQLLKICKDPIVLDADALNIIAEQPELLSDVPPNSIMTPHPLEFQRLVGEWENDFEKLEKQIEFSLKYSVNLVVKGAHSCITNTKGEVFFNDSGNPGMATAGSGDVLTGILAGLLAQQISPENTLKAGVFIHGVAGDIAAAKKGQLSMIASDVIDCLPEAFERVFEF
ncbi:MAG: NAD(P)H-hydrate dehydratase, partial [Bacteroidota bacterium]